MPDPLPQSILCPILIGRDAQVAALAHLLEQARGGHSQIALFSAGQHRGNNDHPAPAPPIRHGYGRPLYERAP